MTNPLLQPNDRWRKPKLSDVAGQNPFTEDASVPPPDRNDPFATPSDEGAGGYAPRYGSSLPSRARNIFLMGLIGFLFCMSPWILILAPDTFFEAWFFVIAAVPIGTALSLTAVVQGQMEMNGVRTGAVDAAGYSWCLVGYTGGVVGLIIVFCGIVAIVLATMNA